MRPPAGGVSGFLLRPVGGVFLFILGAVGCSVVSAPVSQLILQPLCPTIVAIWEGPCTLVSVSPQDSLALMLRQSALAGLLLAMPSLIVVLARGIAPSLSRFTPAAVVPFAFAGGVLAVIGVVFAIFYEAPRAFAPALLSLSEKAQANARLAVDNSGLVVVYMRATLLMAASYAIILQVPLLAIMMIKSWRTGRAIQAEGRA